MWATLPGVVLVAIIVLVLLAVGVFVFMTRRLKGKVTIIVKLLGLGLTVYRGSTGHQCCVGLEHDGADSSGICRCHQDNPTPRNGIEITPKEKRLRHRKSRKRSKRDVV